MKFRKYLIVFSSLFLFLLGSCFSDSGSTSSRDFSKGEVNIYTDRHYPIDDTIYKRFEREFGIKLNVVKGKSEDLLARIEKEGEATKADLLITADVGRLHQAKTAGLFQVTNQPEELRFVPDHLYDEELFWIGLTKRSRIIVYAKERVNSADLSTYENLADKRWKGRIAVRSKENIYNQSLLASLIAANGLDSSLNWVKGVVENMYQSPKGNDRDQVKAVYAGKSDLAIVNTYYLGHMLNSEDAEERKAAESVGVFFPNQEGRGAHINLSGVGLLTHAKQKHKAELLINFLLTKEVQGLYAQANYEFPVRKDVELSEDVLAWGVFKEDDVKLSEIGLYNTEAIKLFDRGGWK